MTHIGHSEKVLVMRVFIAVLVLIFSLQSFTKAEDISDFEIEGISIGDSALEFFDKKEIEERKKIGFVYPDKTFYSATFYMVINHQFYCSNGGYT